MGRLSIPVICSFVLFCAVSAHLINCNVDSTMKLWIDIDDFKVMLDKTIQFTPCCNVFTFGESELTTTLFHEFVKYYRSEYTVNKIIYECTGYLMISTTVENLVAAMSSVPTTISTNNILIVVDQDVEESCGLFNVSIYANAHVRIAAINGLWALSVNYLIPRVFKKILSPFDMEQNHGIINLQGRKLQVAAFFNPPFCDLKTTVNKTVNGIEGEFFTQDNGGIEQDGIEVQKFLLIARVLNFTWSIRKPNKSYRYGRINGSDWHGGMIGQIFHKEVDMAFSEIPYTIAHRQFANLTNPFVKLGTTFLVPRPKFHPDFWALATPLSPEVWGGLVAILIVQSVYVYTSAWVDPTIPKRFRSFTITWTEMMGRLLGTTAPKKMQGLKIQFQLWHFIGVLMITAYSSSLAARLAKRDWQERIDTIQDFVEANLTWGREGPSPLFDNFFDLSDPYAQELSRRFELEKSYDDRYRKMMNGNYAIFGRKIGAAFYPVNFVRPEDTKHYRIMKTTTGEYYPTFAVQSWLLESVNTVMLRLSESGLMSYIIKRSLYQRTPIAFFEVFTEYDVLPAEPRILQLTPLGAGFVVFSIGLFISTVVFYFELRSVRGSKSIREVLLDIKKNRELREIKELNMKRKYLAFKRFSQKKHNLRRVQKNVWSV